MDRFDNVSCQVVRLGYGQFEISNDTSKSECRGDNELCGFGAQRVGMTRRYNFDAKNQQMVFNDTYITKSPSE